MKKQSSIVSVGRRVFKDIKDAKSILLIAALIILPGAAAAESLDDFAAQLLCEEGDACQQTTSKKEEKTIINDVTLPGNADRRKLNEQKRLVPQGLYLTEAGEINPLPISTPQRETMERGELQIKDYGEVHKVNKSEVVIIKIPGRE